MIGESTRLRWFLNQHPFLRALLSQGDHPKCLPVLEAVLLLIRKSPSRHTYQIDKSLFGSVPVADHIAEVMGFHQSSLAFVRDCLDLLVRLKAIAITETTIMVGSHQGSSARQRAAARENGGKGGRPRIINLEEPFEEHGATEVASAESESLPVDALIGEATQERSLAAKTQHETQEGFGSVSLSRDNASVVVAGIQEIQKTTATTISENPRARNPAETQAPSDPVSSPKDELAMQFSDLANKSCPRWSLQQKRKTYDVMRELLASGYSSGEIEVAIQVSADTNGPAVLRTKVRKQTTSDKLSFKSQPYSAGITIPEDPRIEAYPPWHALNTGVQFGLRRIFKVVDKTNLEPRIIAKELRRVREINNEAWDHAARRWPFLTDAANWREDDGEPWPLADALFMMPTTTGDVSPHLGTG